jgi:ABC-2 type transport system ATP-binding protein
MDDVEKVCDRVVVINKGVKVYDDRLEKLVSDYTKIRFIKVFFEEIPENLEKYYYAKVDERNKDSVTFELDKEYVPRLMSDVVTKNNVIDIDIVPVPLEDIIEDIFKKEVKSIV